MERWTDMIELTVTFCNFAKVPKMFFLKKTPGKSLILKIRHMASKKNLHFRNGNYTVSSK